MSNETIALILAAVRKAAREEVAKVEPDLSRPLRYMVGEKGDKGDPGERGLSVIGPQGERGPQGDKGAPGADGRDGKDGTDGKQGPRGPRGIDGQDGRGVSSAMVDAAGNLVIVFDDGEKINAGQVKGPKGDRGARGIGGSGGGTGSDAVGGSATLDFGAAPGTGFVAQTVTDSSITAASRVKVWVQGSTADHNEIEHALIAGRMGLTAAPGSGSFTLYAETELRLTGDVAVKWEAA